ncbi:putative Cof-like hydrolase [Vibrio nigripulchritudo SFn27]|uniref:Putative Cof-like hydrolase n=1 Tax=Vibrio nigripulchritudo TaxID=28173 RepID=U4KCY6_9VIBR|nr:Cof-type HAD-IIB family hydrolase [Vibrio nigripulchritudo]CCN80746.1 putative Cof-like hydrolase [Vibrio nigripulchritudo BLFn1]CCN87842.1 putative Cof-like hydrolase [Vibrio nigripulchritudo SFn27]CCN93729.1 putative Cof-like hydrolase [Vibrio nigripulchritudo ENn2]CCO43100.1 putative Cof-like hydrolase [Vibrio nigripulchritudo SFn135]CCO52525.1 putative Cof-like hydrolase [Vibrio nigripulchritudo Wn13]
MYQAIVSDLDGTLLNSQGVLSSETIRVLEEFHRNGVVIMVATGRFDTDARRVLTGLSFNPVVVSCNGAMIKGSESHPLFTQCLPMMLSESLLNRVADLPFHITVFSEKGWHMVEENPFFEDYIAQSGLTCDYVTDDEIKSIEALKILLQGSEEQVNHYCMILKDEFGAHANICKSSPNTIDIVMKGLSKAEAIKHFLSGKGINMANVVAFGDAMNDLEMLQQAGEGVVMGNAMDELAQAIPQCARTRSNDENGVAHFLMTLKETEVL